TRRKGAQQRGIPVGPKPLGNGSIGSETVEAVKGTGIDMQLDWNTGRDQAPRIVDVLAEEEVEFAHRNIGRRQAGEIGRTRRCRIRRYFGASRLRAKICPPGKPGGAAR